MFFSILSHRVLKKNCVLCNVSFVIRVAKGLPNKMHSDAFFIISKKLKHWHQICDHFIIPVLNVKITNLQEISSQIATKICKLALKKIFNELCYWRKKVFFALLLLKSWSFVWRQIVLSKSTSKTSSEILSKVIIL